jgi:dipeptidyl aminopeptidase/acylaminoacyl peptidase
MTNWIVGHTNRFKAAVTQRSISNWTSFFGVSDIGYYFSEWQIGADMMDVEKLWNHSPLKYAKNIETPLLILHSEKDFRCPIEQAEQLYITLKQMKKETGFVRFPDADHNLSRTGLPNLRYARLEHITDWFKKYL